MPIKHHEVLLGLNDNEVIWRYIAKWKFESILQNEALFFCRTDKFSDPFEGSIPKREKEHRIFEEYKHNPKNPKESIDSLSRVSQRFKRAIVTNCWHINEHESDAMWQLYLKDNEGVAIQSTKEKIFKAFYKTEEEVMPSKVRYIDYENGIFFHPVDYPDTRRNLLKPFIHKRIEFKEENEFRLLHQIHEAEDSEAFWNNETNHKGKLIPIDLNELVDKIILPPTCDSETEEEIKSMTKDYGFDFKIRKSSLNLKPSFL